MNRGVWPRPSQSEPPTAVFSGPGKGRQDTELETQIDNGQISHSWSGASHGSCTEIAEAVNFIEACPCYKNLTRVLAMIPS